MFEDIQNPSIEASATDRVLLYAIWSRDTASPIAPQKAWSLLAERYPDDARFLLFAAFEEHESKSKDWSPGAFLAGVWRLLDRAGGKLNPEVRDLLAVVADELHPLDEADAARLERIRGRVGARVGDAAAARKRLTRFASDVVRELHERTRGDAPIAAVRGPAASPWSEAVAKATGPKRAYSATERFDSGTLVEHPKFGVGVVLSTEHGRVHVLFESGARKLVCG